ncbi:potassium transporter TrkA, partial [Rothia dentocariosa]
RTLYGALAPVAVVPPVGDVQVCPGRDTRVRAGDEVTLIGTPAELAAASVIDDPERVRVSRRSPGVFGLAGQARWVRQLRDLALSLARAADRRLAIALGALLTVLVITTLVLRFTYRYAGPGHRITLIDAMYFTVETVTTVGYGDFSFKSE